MELIYAALLLHRSGKPINEENLKKVITAVGAQVDSAKIKAVVAALEGVDMEKAIKEAAIVSAAPVTHVAPAEHKKEEKKEEKKDDGQVMAGLGALFG
ncbi:50S ribosomal protein P1 [Candidatus Woesearchaeota archaeon]|nr:50S ribosomal protein P1 [Candidatus Woesearchaeota archaeon]